MKATGLLCAVVAAGMGVACTRHNETLTVPGKVVISPLITRVTGLHFDAGDQIGLTVSTPSQLYMDNRLLIYDGEVFAAKGAVWYDDLNEQSVLTAYYPYDAQGTPAGWSVAQDQSSEGFAASDLLAARRSEVTPSVAPVEMLFRHLMTKLSIHVRNNSDASVESVSVAGTTRTARLDFETLTAAATGTADDTIVAHTLTAQSLYEAVIVPQSASLTLNVATSDGQTRAKTIASTNLLPGHIYTVEVTVNNAEIEASVSGQIEDWIDGGKLTPEIPEDPSHNDSPDPITYAGATYKTATLRDGRVWMAANLRYVPQGKTASDDPAEEAGIWFPCTEEGKSSPEDTFVEAMGLLYDVETALGSEAITKASGVGICPDGWHIPTEEEFRLLVAAYEPPYAELAEFFTFCGIRSVVGPNARYNAMASEGRFTKAYIAGATPDLQNEGKYLHLCFDVGTGAPSVTLQPLSARYGVPVRCLQDR